MKNILRKILSISIVCIMLASLLAVCANAETIGKGTEENPWFVGAEVPDNVFAYIKDHTLYLTGNGAVMDFGNIKQPWAIYRSSISKIIVTDNISALGKNSFGNLTNVEIILLNDGMKEIGSFSLASTLWLHEITLPESIEKIDSFAFANSAVTKIDVPASVKEICKDAFINCSSLGEINFGGTISEWKKVCNTGFDTNVTIHCIDGDEYFTIGDRVGSPICAQTILIIAVIVEFIAIVVLAAVIVCKNKKKCSKK